MRTNQIPNTAMRAPGALQARAASVVSLWSAEGTCTLAVRAQSLWMMEAIFDHLGAAMNKDPKEVKEANFYQAGARPTSLCRAGAAVQQAHPCAQVKPRPTCSPLRT